jgi:hypothetical protein
MYDEILSLSTILWSPEAGKMIDAKQLACG